MSRQDEHQLRVYTDGTSILGTGTRAPLGGRGEGRMVQPQPLHVGELVRTIALIAELPVGAHGIVRAIFPLGDFYDVFFSEGIGLRIVHRNTLEHLRLSQDRTTAGSA
jgi:hypothetical protein